MTSPAPTDAADHAACTGYQDAAEDVVYRVHRLTAATTVLDEADALVNLSNAMSDLRSWLPGYDGDSGTMPWDRGETPILYVEGTPAGHTGCTAWVRDAVMLAQAVGALLEAPAGKVSDIAAHLPAYARALAVHLPGYDPATRTMPWERGEDS